ncbi:hypothetical protein I0P17_18940, partial [Acinetobacter baumannii]|uniref:hypothetical protein n=1 Tax=Acinetobacter baumannii TaxID=470 RepID=UPI0018AFDECB
REQALPLAINPNSDQYLEERLQLLDEQLATVTRLAKDNELPDAILTVSGLKVSSKSCKSRNGEPKNAPEVYLFPKSTLPCAKS